MNIVQIYRRYPSHKACLDHLEQVRWRGKPLCPYCGSPKQTPMPNENRYHCNNCNTSFRVTVGTIFHNTKLDLQRWFLGISLILNAKKGISARQLARDLEINKNTAWYMAMRIRKAMAESVQRQILSGLVEADETYIGGKPRKGGGGGPSPRGRGTKKTPVVGMVERGGNVKARAVKKADLTIKKMSSLVRANVDTDNTTLFTDEFSGYLGIKKFMDHKTVNHRIWYVDGRVHTNTIESFWALLKRGIVGQFHKVSVKHLNRYIDEFCYRYNHRNNANVFGETILRSVGGAR